jgi:hypothetical protein
MSSVADKFDYEYGDAGAVYDDLRNVADDASNLLTHFQGFLCLPARVNNLRYGCRQNAAKLKAMSNLLQTYYDQEPPVPNDFTYKYEDLLTAHADLVENVCDFVYAIHLHDDGHVELPTEFLQRLRKKSAARLLAMSALLTSLDTGFLADAALAADKTLDKFSI